MQLNVWAKKDASLWDSASAKCVLNIINDLIFLGINYSPIEFFRDIDNKFIAELRIDQSFNLGDVNATSDQAAFPKKSCEKTSVTDAVNGLSSDHDLAQLFRFFFVNFLDLARVDHRLCGRE